MDEASIYKKTKIKAIICLEKAKKTIEDTKISEGYEKAIEASKREQ